MGFASWNYPSGKKLGSRTVWVWEDVETKERELYLPSFSDRDPIRVERIARLTSLSGVVHRISGGTEEARKRLLRRCTVRGIQAQLA